MLIYYFNAKTGKHIDEINPIDMTYAETYDIFIRLSGSGSFMGLEIQEELVLQFLLEKGVFWTEFLNTARGKIIGTHLTVPQAEKALKAAFDSGQVDSIKFAATASNHEDEWLWEERVL